MSPEEAWVLLETAAALIRCLRGREAARYFYSPDGNTWRVQDKGGTVTEFGRALFAPELSGDDEATERDVLSSDNAPVFGFPQDLSMITEGLSFTAGNGRTLVVDFLRTFGIRQKSIRRSLLGSSPITYSSNGNQLFSILP